MVAPVSRRVGHKTTGLGLALLSQGGRDPFLEDRGVGEA
jgi:hypothetical protein